MLDILYDPPWTRIGPYIIGMMTAYIIIKLNNRLHLHKVLNYSNMQIVADPINSNNF